MITVQEIKAKVSSDPRWATRALLALYECQTEEEQASSRTVVKNCQGFNGTDATILSSFSVQVLKGWSLTQRQLEIAYKKLPKYAQQLAALACARAQSA